MTPDWETVFREAKSAGMPKDQVTSFLKAGIVLQPKQMRFAGAARACDDPQGPVSIGLGGARGGGKTTAMIAQIAADDCQRMPDIKFLWLRKVGKANLEHLDDLRRTTLRGVPHTFRRNDGTISFANGSRIICGHYQNESDIDAYLGLEYDGIGIEEATTLQESKYRNIRTCLRSSKANWRPRDYSTANPGGIGHGWYKNRFIMPMRQSRQTETRFIASTCLDNRFNNPEYIKVLQSLTGWQRRAWLDGDWDITAGQFFTNWREEQHVIETFDDRKAVSWFCALDWGFRHWCVILLGCVTGDGNMVIVDEQAAQRAVPAWHVQEAMKMLKRHSMTSFGQLEYFVAGGDVFGTESDGSTVAGTFADLGMPLTITECWNDRVNGWAEILRRLGDPDRENFNPTLLVTRKCKGLIERMPLMLHDPNKPDDMDKVDCDEEGNGGDDFLDAARYLVISYKRGTVVRMAQPMRMGSFAGRSV